MSLQSLDFSGTINGCSGKDSTFSITEGTSGLSTMARYQRIPGASPVRENRMTTNVSYYVKCTVENSQDNISQVGYSRTLSRSVGGKRKEKSNVIYDIDELDKNVMTAFKHMGSWEEGDKIHVVEGEYIRTDGNNIESDNLGELPGC